MRNIFIFAWICTCFTIYAQEVKKATVVNLRELSKKHPFNMDEIRAQIAQIDSFERFEKDFEEDYEILDSDSVVNESHTPVAKLTSTGDSPAPYFDFDAVSSNGSNPPDINAAVGDGYLVSCAQGGILKIMDLSGNAIMMVNYNILFNTVAHDIIDPQLKFDNIEKRWIMSGMGDFFYSYNPPNSYTTEVSIVLAVSATSDPTGNWYIYKIDTDPLCDEAADPNNNDCKVSVDQPWIGYNTNFLTLGFVSAQPVSNTQGNATLSEGVTRIIIITDKYALYNHGLPTNLMPYFDYLVSDLQGTNSGTNIVIGANTYPNKIGSHFHPCVNEDTNFPDAMYFMRAEVISPLNSPCSRIEITKVELLGSTGQYYLSIQNFPSVSSNFSWQTSPQNGNPLPQLGANNISFSVSNNLFNVVYKNGYLWTVQTVYSKNNVQNIYRRALLYWQVKVDAANNATSVEQCGMIDDDLSKNTALTTPSIAVNRLNDVLVGYSFFREDIYPSAAYSLRRFTDTPNEMRKPYIYGNGTTIYPNSYIGQPLSGIRWGDYSASFTDDVNDEDFWTIQEYSAPPCQNCWNTRMARVGLDPICDISYDLNNVEYQTIQKYESGDYITSKSEIIGHSHILYDAENYIRLLPGSQGFHVENGSTFHAYINGCGNTKQKENNMLPSITVSNTIICYPNPTEDMLSFGFWESIQGEVFIEIFDSKGQKVQNLVINPQEEIISISVNTLISGIYFWKIQYKNQFYTGKFIKS